MRFLRRVSNIIIPTVYQDALSYGQLLERIRCTVNKIANWINELEFVSSINGKTGDVTLRKLRFTGYSNAEYNGTDEVTVRIPTGVGPNELAQLTFTGGADAVYDGSEAKTINIPNVKSVNGQTGDVSLSARDVGAVATDDLPSALPNPMPIIFTDGLEETRYDGSETVAICLHGGGSGEVTSVNGETGNVVITPEKIGAIPATQTRFANPYPVVFEGAVSARYDGSSEVHVNIPQGGGSGGGVTSVNGQTGAVQLNANDVGAIPQSVTTLPNPKSLFFTGAVQATYDGRQEVTINIPEGGGSGSGVTSVNGRTGAVTLTAGDVGALPNTTQALPNPQALSIITSDGTDTYNGSAAKQITLPSRIDSATRNEQTTSGAPGGSIYFDRAGLYIVKINAPVLGLSEQTISNYELMFSVVDSASRPTYMFYVNQYMLNTPFTFTYADPPQYNVINKVFRLYIS